MNEKKGKLKVIAKTGGIKVEGSDAWLNPSNEAKERILKNLDTIKQWQGRNIILTMQDNKTYSGIGLNEAEEEKVKETKLDKSGATLLSPQNIIRLQGKDFVTHAGLLEVAHKVGIKSITTNLVHREKDIVIMKARVIMSSGSVYEAYGDAGPNNVNRMILPHVIRMAETRAVNRALRFATNIGMCSIEELGEDNDNKENEMFSDAEKI